MIPARRLAVTASIVAVVPLVAVAVLAGAGELAPAEVADPGPVIRWGLPVVRGLRDAAAAATIGLLVLSTLVLPRDDTDADRLSPIQQTAARSAAAGGAAWMTSSVAVIVLTFAQLAGIGALDAALSPRLGTFLLEDQQGRLLVGSTVLIAAATGAAWSLTREVPLILTSVVAVAALLPVALTGHTAAAVNHDAAVNLQFTHVAAMCIWVGGLGALALLRRALAEHFPAAARRFSTLAGVCYVLVAVSGVAGALVRADGLPDVTSTYGTLLVVKTALLLVLGVAGWVHRTSTLTALDTSAESGHPFARLATGELTVMAVAMGLGIALSSTSPM
ncbi:copper resistance D family protein [Cellulomonas sp. 179-A 4D5 NHS]|uniref:copper resistance D family protein n=1 Tax=Cellulomonas sp. 179-A 4D5 NHS TaxID=3142378 RepID=UPI0039A138D7